MEECFSVQITWKISSKINKNPGKLEFMDSTHEILFCQERSGILGRTRKIDFFTQRFLWRLFPDPSPKRPPTKINFFERNQMKS